MTTPQRTPTPADAEADAEHAREGLITTLDRLRDNLQPAHVVEEVMTNVKVSVSALSDQIWDTARRNPLPALMIGAGVAMIFGLGVRASTDVSDGAARGPARSGEGMREPEHEGNNARPVSDGRTRSALGSAYQSIGAQAGDLLDTANDHLAGMASAVGSIVQQLPFNSNSGDRMSSLRPRGTLLTSISKAIEDQPLILAALGVAVGAAIGAAIPQTETENNLLGESSHSVRDAAQDLVRTQYAQLKTAASHAVDDIKQSVADHGATPENLAGLVHDVAEKAKTATYEAGRTLDPTQT